MFNQVLVDYLQRFSNVMTESVYASKGIQDYNRMKRYSDYLDYDSQTLFRDKEKSQAGLRNIGNTCYLNVILQLLFHVNYLRDRLFNSEHHKSELVQLLRGLFAEMSIGKLAFADPTDLFQHLKSSNSEVFVSGVQNDFHQIFTLLIDKLSDSYKEVSPEEARFISKILFGKMNTKIDYGEGITNKLATFNIINLDVAQGSFQKSFERWKSYKIDGYETPKGTKVNATAQNIFIQTPALMTFFINRVGYKNNKLQKDSRIFQFDHSILINKLQQSDKTKQTKIKNVQSQKQLLSQKASLLQWVEKIQKQKTILSEALKYLRYKQAPLLSQPQIENQLGQASLNTATLYIEKEIEKIDLKVAEVQKINKNIDQRLKKLQEEGNYQTYLLWAVMIHQGTSAVHGHYKVCIKINESWVQYNDRIVSVVPSSKIQGYKSRGEICCLFYRRPNLFCDNQRRPIPHSLKLQVSQQQKKIKQEIDKARLLQSLYQQTQSANILLEHEIHNGINQRFHFFFKPVHYAISQHFPLQTCKGILIMETISTDSFKTSFNNKLISDQANFTFNRVKFGIPDEYFAASDILKAFLNKQAFLYELPSAYEELANKRINFNSKKLKERYYQMLEIIVLKGLYYLHRLSQNRLIDYSNFKKINVAIDKILESMSQSSEFVLVAIAVKSSIVGNKYEPKEIKSFLKNMAIDSYGSYFCQNFKYWINQRRNISRLDELNFFINAPPLPFFKDI